MIRGSLFGCVLFASPVAAQYDTNAITRCATDMANKVSRCTSWSTSGLTAGATTLDPRFLDSYCGSPCFATYYSAMLDYGDCLEKSGMPGLETVDLKKSLAAGMDYMCTKNFKGEYCMAQTALLSEISTSLANNDYQDPASLYCAWISELGCCYSSLLDVASVSVPSASVTTSAIQNYCGFDALPPKCPGFEHPVPFTKSTFTLSGLVAAYQAADSQDKLKISLAITKDVAASLGVDASRVSIEISIAGSELEVSATLISDDDSTALVWKTLSITKLAGLKTWTNTQAAAPNALALVSNGVSAETGTAEYATRQGVSGVGRAAEGYYLAFGATVAAATASLF